MLPIVYNNKRLGNLVDEVEQNWHKLVDSFFNPNNVGDLKSKLKGSTGYPRVDVFTTQDSYCIQASVTGVSPDDLSVEVFSEGQKDEARYVRISGHMSQEHTSSDDDAVFITKELCRKTFARTLSLPEYVEGDPEATIKEGVLTLKWKLEKPKTDNNVKRIPIKT